MPGHRPRLSPILSEVRGWGEGVLPRSGFYWWEMCRHQSRCRTSCWPSYWRHLAGPAPVVTGRAPSAPRAVTAPAAAEKRPQLHLYDIPKYDRSRPVARTSKGVGGGGGKWTFFLGGGGKQGRIQEFSNAVPLRIIFLILSYVLLHYIKLCVIKIYYLILYHISILCVTSKIYHIIYQYIILY